MIGGEACYFVHCCGFGECGQEWRAEPGPSDPDAHAQEVLRSALLTSSLSHEAKLLLQPLAQHPEVSVPAGTVRDAMWHGQPPLA